MELVSLQNILKRLKKEKKGNIFASKSASEIVENNSSFEKEIAVSKQLQSLCSNSCSFFLLMEDSSPIVVMRGNKEETISSHVYAYYKNKSNAVEFVQYLHNYSGGNDLDHFFLSAFRHLLRGLQLLQNTLKGVFFGFWRENAIMYDLKGEKPLIAGFQSYFCQNEMPSLENIEKNQIIPELKVYVYMKRNNLETLSISNLSLDLASEENKKYIQNFLNKKRENIEKEIFSWSASWDLYYLNYLISQMPFCPFFLKNVCDNYLKEEPNKRTSLENFIWQVDRVIIQYFSEKSK